MFVGACARRTQGVPVDYEHSGFPVTVGMVKQVRPVTGPWTDFHV